MQYAYGGPSFHLVEFILQCHIHVVNSQILNHPTIRKRFDNQIQRCDLEFSLI